MNTPTTPTIPISAIVLGQHYQRGANVMALRLTKALGRRVSLDGHAVAPVSCLAHVRTGDRVTLELQPADGDSLPLVVTGSVNGVKPHRRHR